MRRRIEAVGLSITAAAAVMVLAVAVWQAHAETEIKQPNLAPGFSKPLIRDLVLIERVDNMDKRIAALENTVADLKKKLKEEEAKNTKK